MSWTSTSVRIRSLGAGIRATLIQLLAVGMLVALGRPAMAADEVTFWNETAITTSAVHLGRAAAMAPVDLAYMHAAIYDVVVALHGGYKPFAVQLTDVPADASVNAAIASAAHRVLATMFPTDQAYIDSRYALALSALPNGISKDQGIAIGEQVAVELLTARAGDGWNAFVPYFPGSGPGVWQPTPPAFTPAIAPWLAVMRPFTFPDASQFRSDPPPAFGSRQWADDYNEVQLVGSVSSAIRTPEQTDIARFYGEHAGIQYARILRALAEEKGLSLDDDARLFAMVYITEADTTIGCFDSKYHYSFWRPITAIHAGDTDGNSRTTADPTWTPLLGTPGHPEYPSAHGCFTAALAETLATFFGTKKVSITLTSMFPAAPLQRTFESTDDLVHEIIDARVYEGIHYRTSTVTGAVLGRRVAHWVAKHEFQPVD